MKRVMSTVACGLLLHGCQVVPVELEPAALELRIERDLSTLTAGQEPISGPLTLYEAMARALKYNLDYRVEAMEQAVAQGQLEVSRWELLPSLVARAGYTGRDEPSGASSRSLLTGRTSLEPSTSTDRDLLTADLGLTWNVLDFGLSYVRAQQQSDRVLIAAERRRKVAHAILQDVRRVYWRAVSAERLRQRMQGMAGKVEQALRESEEAERKALGNPLTTLTYQRELLDIKRELDELQRELVLAKAQLAALINAHPRDELTLHDPRDPGPVRRIDWSPEEVELLALEQRPELHELDYRGRILARETRAALLGLLPGIELNVGRSYDSNSFLFANDWYRWGAQVSFNLLDVFSAPTRFAEVDAQIALNDTRRLALSMAVVTQVYVSMAEFEQDRRMLDVATVYAGTQARIVDQVRKAYGAGRVSQQSVIREEMNALLADARRDVAHARLENSYAGVFVTMGMDPLPEAVPDYGVQTLAAALGEHWESR